ncbi:CYTH domain-containing protein [Corallincola platygyrae]|uniref:CYTH domain-containing protein n=1 Tax=Corallincola platygyrae TaxID=1193278 RepID=A0ABW4XP44_9GAMM
MDTEIEIKLVISGESDDLVQAIESAADVYFSADKQLANIYFDTPDRQLRDLDIGLRVRSTDDVAVQTIKTAGRVVGGLHQRPEYNLPIEGSRPDITLFPEDIWPDGVNKKKLQKKLVPIFSTNFRRRSWCLRFDDGSEVEVALDLGLVEANHLEEPIAEVEFELLKGDPDHLFGLARTVSNVVPARLGHLSKAARGYRLAKGEVEYPVCKLRPVSLERQSSVETAFEATVKSALDTIQHNEQSFLTSPSFRAVEALYYGYLWLQQVFEAYKEAIPLEASETLRDELKWLMSSLSWVREASHRQHALEDDGHFLRKLDDQALIVSELQMISEQSPDQQEVSELLLSTRYCQLVLSLTEWLFEQGWRRYMVGDKDALEQSIKSSGRQQLTSLWQQLHLSYQGDEFNGQLYQEHFAHLEIALGYRLCFADLFSAEQGADCAEPWLDLYRGSKEWHQLNYLEQLAESWPLKEREQFLKWLKRKRKSLLHALEQSRFSAIQSPIFG